MVAVKLKGKEETAIQVPTIGRGDAETIRNNCLICYKMPPPLRLDGPGPLAIACSSIQDSRRNPFALPK